MHAGSARGQQGAVGADPAVVSSLAVLEWLAVDCDSGGQLAGNLAQGSIRPTEGK